MANPQREFLKAFKAAFANRFPACITWGGGQAAVETAGLQPNPQLRRGGVIRRGESFELGDVRCDFGTFTVIIEYDRHQVLVHNLLKYWPYLRGELSRRPAQPLLLCHFSDWWSYGSHRDLWQWTLARMQDDPERTVDIHARQFDHRGEDIDLGAQSVSLALDWLAETMQGRASRGAN